MTWGRWRDPASAAGVALVAVLGALTSPPGRSPLDALGVGLLLVAALSTAVRRRTPLLTLAVTVVAGLGYEARGYPGLAPIVPFLVALATAAWSGHRRPAVGAAAVMVAGGLLVQRTIGRAPSDTPEDVTQRWFLAIGWMVAAIVAGTLAARYQTYLAAVEQRAEEAERTREEVARRRADEERLRIARELHDSLTHSISIIKVQAGVAIHLARKRDEPVPEALLAIEQAGGEAMRELRATLEVLRGDEETGSGLDHLDHLVEGARQAGLPIHLAVTGDRRDVPAPVGRAAYRIIQEALTNVRRHAGPQATASVQLTYHPAELSVRVDNDGPPRPPRGGDPFAAAPARPAGSRPSAGHTANDGHGPTSDHTPDNGHGVTSDHSANNGHGGTLDPSANNGHEATLDHAADNSHEPTPDHAADNSHEPTSDRTTDSRDGARLDHATSSGHSTSVDRTWGPSRPASPSGAGSGAGVGLRGMRERVAALGGSLEVGPADGGGFRVHARLPLAAP